MHRKYGIRPERRKKMMRSLINKENQISNNGTQIDGVPCCSVDISLKPSKNDNLSCPKSIPTLDNCSDQTCSELESDNTSDIIEGTPPPLVQKKLLKPLANNKANTSKENQKTEEESSSGSVGICRSQLIIEETSSDSVEKKSTSPSILAPENINNEAIVSGSSLNYNNDDVMMPPETSDVTPGMSTDINKEPAWSLEDDLFLSDDSVADPDWNNPDKNNKKSKKISSSEESDTDAEPVSKKKRQIKTTRWHKRRDETYDRNKQKILRSQCLPYMDYKKRLQPPKAPKLLDCHCRLRCSEHFTNDDRSLICKNYWGLTDYKRQKDYILTHVKEYVPQRRLTNSTRKNYLRKQDQTIRVCEKFFKATLDISNGPINKAFKGAGSWGTFESQDNRGNHEPHNKTNQNDENYVKQHIESFPTMESHYCRKTSSKKYLENNLSIPKMYELYEKKCEEDGKPPVSINVYRRIFCTQYNLDFHKTKKDQCITCNKYKTAKNENSTDLAQWKEKYDQHIILKNQSQQAKDLDKIRANEDESFNSITLDLQKVLHIPNSKVSLLYYLRKLNVYNATIYEARSPNNGYCFIWNELNGKKGSDEVGTALYLWIKRLPINVIEISIFTDTCGGQNRNQFLMCLLLYMVQKTNIQVIEHKYLESGHSHMEVDSIHSAIEHQLKDLSAFSMNDYCNVIRMARSKRNKKKGETPKKPYEPVIMNYMDILDLKELKTSLMKNRSFSTEGDKVQWMKVKCFRYEKKLPNVVLYRYDYESDYKEIDVVTGITLNPEKKTNLRNRKHRKNVDDFSYDHYTLKKAYDKMIPITKAKKRDLIKMCTEKIIPSELHPWFNSIPDKEGIDYLPDEEDHLEE